MVRVRVRVRVRVTVMVTVRVRVTVRATVMVTVRVMVRVMVTVRVRVRVTVRVTVRVSIREANMSDVQDETVSKHAREVVIGLALRERGPGAFLLRLDPSLSGLSARQVLAALNAEIEARANARTIHCSDGKLLICVAEAVECALRAHLIE